MANPILHLGVIDVGYSDANGKKSGTPNATTGDVAEILERQYGIMQTFFDLHQDEILTAAQDSLAGALESLALGQTAEITGFESAADKIQTMFKQFLSNQEMDGHSLTPNRPVPTGAALRGVSHRFKHPYAKRAPRPAFIDTGLFSASFRTWLDWDE